MIQCHNAYLLCYPSRLPVLWKKPIPPMVPNFIWPHVKSVNHIDDGLSVKLSDGNTLRADLVVSAVGVRPRTNLAKTAGIDVDRGIRPINNWKPLKVMFLLWRLRRSLWSCTCLCRSANGGS